MASEESTPLLAPSSAKRTTLPWKQLYIILLLQIAEPLTAQVIFPFAPQLVREIGITKGDETKVGFYVGVLESIFFVGQAITVLYWSRLSDYIGRKPVILLGSFGLAFSMWCFGLSMTYWGIFISRCLSGVLNGNLGVIKSMMAEVTDETNIAQAFAYYPLARCTGTTLGPLIGGYLSHPAEQFPGVFGDVDLLETYPYLLACAVPAIFSTLLGIICLFWLTETVKNPIPIVQFLHLTNRERIRSPDSPATSQSDFERPLPLRQLLTKRVIVVAGNYAFLALNDVVLRAVQPVFFSTPVAYGGLDLSTSKIGTLLSMRGILTAIFQVFFFAKIFEAWGPKKTYLAGIVSFLPTFALFPILSSLVRIQGNSWLLFSLVILQNLLPISVSMAYGAIFIYIAGASPNRASVGAMNGLNQMVVSIFRAFGPVAANSLYSLSLAKGYMGGFMVYYGLIAITLWSLWLASLLPNK